MTEAIRIPWLARLIEAHLMSRFDVGPHDGVRYEYFERHDISKTINDQIGVNTQVWDNNSIFTKALELLVEQCVVVPDQKGRYGYVPEIYRDEVREQNAQIKRFNDALKQSCALLLRFGIEFSYSEETPWARGKLSPKNLGDIEDFTSLLRTRLK